MLEDPTLVLLYHGSYCITSFTYLVNFLALAATPSSCLRLTPFTVDGIFPSVFRLTSAHEQKWDILSHWSKVKVQLNNKEKKNCIMLDLFWHMGHTLKNILIAAERLRVLFLNFSIISPLCLVWVQTLHWSHVRQAKSCLWVCQVFFFFFFRGSPVFAHLLNDRSLK